MTDTAIRVENLGKRYQLGAAKSGSFRESMSSLFRRNGSPTSNTPSHPESNPTPNPQNPTPHTFWALQDINFEIKRGEAVGIIGRNGAGKSTLLKILSRITEPTRGRFEVFGRVSSLLEVGTGFHPELTGRENVYLNGTILGMKRREVKAKFDEIVAFSGVEKFIDTPVKHYSSGMQVRLAFAVAAHLEPEILIIDEVLAVGDAEFQKKCLGKMEDVTGEGRTVLFVSHNLAAVSQLCEKGVLLRNGVLADIGEVEQIIHSYISYNRSQVAAGELINLNLRKGNGYYRVRQVKLLNAQYKPISIARTGSEVVFEINLDKRINKSQGAFRIDFAIDTEQDMRVGWFSSDAVISKMNEEFDTILLTIPRFGYGSGTYYLTFFGTWNGEVVDYIHQGFSFDVEEGDFFGTGMLIPASQTFIYTDHEISSN